MFRKIIILLIAAGITINTEAQNVGIGSTNPTAKLHIKGNADTSQLVIDANATQSNTHPLVRLRSSTGLDLMHIHSDDISNVFIGINTGRANITGTGLANSFIGSSAGSLNTSGYNNTASGSQALFFNTSGYNNTALGAGALFYNNYKNTNNTNSNTGIGAGALASNERVSDNTAIGAGALKNIYDQLSGYNTAVRSLSQAGHSYTANTSLGYKTLMFNNGGNYNTAVGYRALYSNDFAGSNFNNAFGHNALYTNITGISNIAFGINAAYSNTAGNNNIVIGPEGMSYNTTGNYNVGIGFHALNKTTISEYNTVLGYNAASLSNNGYNNVFLGANLDVNSGNLYDDVGIGQGTVCTTSSQVTMGNSATVSYRAYANWSNISDGRFKTNVQENVPGLSFITKLRTVTYNLKAADLDLFLHKNTLAISQQNIKATDQQSMAAKAFNYKALEEKSRLTNSGFVAQEVEATAKQVDFNFSGLEAPAKANDVYGLRYAEFVVPLVKGMQEQKQQIEALQIKNLSLQIENDSQNNILANQQLQLDAIKLLIKNK